MHQPAASHRSLPPARPRHTRAPRPALVAAAVSLLVLTGCGRSADTDALGSTEGDPDIAGVVVTSPDAVVTPAPGEPADATTSSTATTLPQQVLYTVEPGDTLSVIASQFGVPTEELAAFNGITDVNAIKPGDQLAIPPVVAAPEAAPDAATDPAAEAPAEGDGG
ncbi:MAG: LysM peptidoglycan-binding domain-containing protein [Actinomycetota bacterium]